MNTTELWDLIFDNIKKIIFPEEWLKLDLALSKQEVFTLMLLGRRREIMMSEIADYVNVSMSTATGIVDRLIKNGFLDRNRSDSDRRVVMIKLTEKGKSLADQIRDVGDQYFQTISNSLTDDERNFLIKILTKIIATMNEKTKLTRDTDGNENRLNKIKID